MKSKNLIAKILFFSFVLLSCGNIIDRQKNLSTEDRINDEMSKLPLPSQMPEGEFTLESNPADPDFFPSNSKYIFIKRKCYASSLSEKFLAGDMQSYLLWPGVIIDSSSFLLGAGKIISSPNIIRAPINLVIDGSCLRTSISLLIEKPDEKTINHMVYNLMDQQDMINISTYSDYSYLEIGTASELTIKLKTAYGYMSPDVEKTPSVLYKSNENVNTTKVIIEYTQCFFSINTSLISKASDFFDLNQTSWDEIAAAIPGTRTAPVFISSVDYGRSLLAVIESEKQYNEIENNIKAYGLFLKGSSDANVLKSVNELKAISSITGIASGGESSVLLFSSFDEINNWMETINSTGSYKPIRYSLKYLSSPDSDISLRFITGGIYYKK
jgi:hypothetical protein